MQCDHRPGIWASRVDFDNRLAIASYKPVFLANFRFADKPGVIGPFVGLVLHWIANERGNDKTLRSRARHAYYRPTSFGQGIRRGPADALGCARKHNRLCHHKSVTLGGLSFSNRFALRLHRFDKISS
jgi:hypothetical protein